MIILVLSFVKNSVSIDYFPSSPVVLLRQDFLYVNFSLCTRTGPRRSWNLQPSTRKSPNLGYRLVDLNSSTPIQAYRSTLPLIFNFVFNPLRCSTLLWVLLHPTSLDWVSTEDRIIVSLFFWEWLPLERV